jgi:hypothetical protein
MLSICDALEATDAGTPVEEFVQGSLVAREFYVTPLALATAMEGAAARIRDLTD